MEFDRKSEISSHVELSPLIDLIFILLLFFIVTTTFKLDSGLAIDLPESGSKMEGQADDLVVSVDAEGQIRVDDTPVAIERLEQELRRAIEANADLPISIRADGRAQHSLMVSIYEAVQKAGGKGFGIETVEPPPRPAP